MNVAAAFAVGLGLGAPPRLLAGQLVELGVQSAGVELLFGSDFFAAFPPVGILRRVGNGLGAGFGRLIDIRAVPFLIGRV